MPSTDQKDTSSVYDESYSYKNFTTDETVTLRSCHYGPIYHATGPHDGVWNDVLSARIDPELQYIDSSVLDTIKHAATLSNFIVGPCNGTNCCSGICYRMLELGKLRS